MWDYSIFKVRTSNQPLTLEQIIQEAKPAAPPMSLSTVYRCVTVISESVAMLPVNLYEVSGEAMRKLTALDHPLTRVLNYAPDSRMTRYTFLQAIVRSMLLRGNAYAHIKRQGGNVELVFIHPDKVEIVRKKTDNKIPYLTYKVEGFDRQLDASEVLHFINLSDDGLEGESVLTHARRSLSIAGNSETQAENYYKGDGVPSGILSIATRMTAEQKAANYKTWRERMTNNPGGIMILEGATQSFTPINISAADRQLLEVRAFSVQDICRFFGCSPVKAFDLSHSSYSTVEALQLEFLTDTLQPMLTNIEMELHRKLFYGADAAKYAVKFDTGELLRADKSSQAQYYSQLVQLGLMTPNEARIELNLPPMKGGNALYMQGAMMPVEQIINNNKKCRMMDVKALKLKYNIASMMVYEQVTGKPFQLDGSMTSMVLLIWSIIEANNPGTIALKDMIAWLDDHPEDMHFLVTEVSRLIKISSGLVDADNDDDKKSESPSVTELFEAIVGLGADPQWVLYDLRLSMYDVVMRALARRQREEWERTRVATIIGAQASGARLKWDDLPNPYDSTDKQPAKCSDIEAARKRLKELKRKQMKATDYITMEEAKQHLVVDASYTGDDALIESYLDNALTIVLSESCNTIEMLLDEDGQLDKVAKQAVLLKLGDLYAYREGNYNGSINQVHGGYDRLIGLIRNYS